jgi:hypothetical protein
VAQRRRGHCARSWFNAVVVVVVVTQCLHWVFMYVLLCPPTAYKMPMGDRFDPRTHTLVPMHVQLYLYTAGHFGPPHDTTPLVVMSMSSASLSQLSLISAHSDWRSSQEMHIRAQASWFVATASLYECVSIHQVAAEDELPLP